MTPPHPAATQHAGPISSRCLRPPAAPALALAAAPLGPPVGFRLAGSSEVRTGTALVGQAVLYRWPVDGWVRGTVTGRSRTAGFSHVVRYGSTSAIGSAAVPSLLDAASHGPAGRWVLLRCLTH